ncbi:hypothetical protein FE257_005812 [Aspergillus nanangensis]|uniref:Heterokaryon incompatibility domain-containing protein n=1 Tax=Aspergillus nanangensis TaxID=2582783 RepID=A0AAD4CA32_ASPNN|nr:hypothetical protein FE257_005812 [Aspergillus nanangensis]
MQPFEFTPYEYAPLPTPSSIRLVSLLKPPPNTPQPSIAGLPLLHLSIETVDLNDKPAFSALSYTWGYPFGPDSKRKADDYDGALHRYPVAINGRLLLISRNLYEFLCHFDTDDTDPDVDRRFPPFNKTGLIRATEEGRLEDLRGYLARSADLFAQDIFGETALHYAAENGYFETVKLLVKAGSSQTQLDSTRRTPLDCARMRRRRQYRQVVAFLERSQQQQQEETHVVELPPKRPRCLWIDAICSNQESIPERNAQVALMPRIYSSARKIVVWLGVADELTAAGHKVLNQPRPQGSWSHDEQVWRMTAREVALKLDPERENFDNLSPEAARALKDYRGVSSIAERTWFNRSWTLQEVLLGTDYEYRCGKYIFTHFNLDSIVSDRIDWLGDGFGPRRTEDPSFTGQRAEESVLRSPGIAAFHRLSLQALVAFTREMVATDPRDKIFALLSLARPPDNPQNVITADYSIPVNELFTKFAASFMEGCPDGAVLVPAALEPLEGLSSVQFHQDSSSTHDLPSWVPDFGSPPSSYIIWSRRFRAATELGTPTIHPLDDPNLLCVLGVMIDEVEVVEQVTKDTYFPVSKRWMDFIRPLAPTYYTGQSRSEVLWRTLIANDIWRNVCKPSMNFAMALAFTSVQDEFRLENLS